VEDVAFGTSAATEDRANAGQQFRNGERFGDEVIRASVQGADAVFDRGFGGNEDEVYRASAAERDEGNRFLAEGTR
jgi:hypothetical protein